MPAYRVPTLAGDEVRGLRFRAQGLRPGDAGVTVRQVVARLGGVQAQAPRSATLAIRPRSRGLTASHVDHAKEVERSIVATWCFRGTLHWVSSQDVGWMVALLGPRIIGASQRRMTELGLDEERIKRSLRLIRSILATRGPLTRAEIATHLVAHGVKIDPKSQAVYHLIRRAGLEGILCVGPSRNGKDAYVLLDDWIGSTRRLEERAALAELARRYLDGYGPASVRDFIAWSGLSASQARTAWNLLAGELVEFRVSAISTWMLKRRASLVRRRRRSKPTVRLLAAFDPYLLGYESRDLAVPPLYARRVHPGGGVLAATAITDGLAVGTWRLEKERQRGTIVVDPFEKPSAEVTVGLRAEA